MANPLKNFEFFRKSLTHLDFLRLYQEFESNRERYLQDYAAASDNLYRRFYQQTRASTDPHLVSAVAKSKHLLAEFCFARFVELYKERVTGLDAVRDVQREVEKEDWPLSPTTPSPRRLQGGLYDLVRNTLVFVSQTYQQSRVLQFTRDYYITAICVVLAITVAAYILALFVNFMGSTIDNLIETLPGGGFLVWSLRKAVSAMPWNQRPSAPISPSTPGVPSLRRPEIISNMDSAAAAAFVTSVSLVFSNVTTLLNTWSGLLYLPVPSRHEAVDLPSTPVPDGLHKAANNSMYMAEVAANLSALPVLLHHSRKGILGASDELQASKLKYKDQLAAEYKRLEHGMDGLIDVLKLYNSGVPDLLQQYANLLSMTLSQTADVTSISAILPDSPLVHVSLLCNIWWFWPQVRLRNWKKFLGCDALSAASVAAITCSRNPEYLARNSLCSALLTYTPGVSPYPERFRRAMQRALYGLEEFVMMLDLHVRELYDVSENGTDLCLTLGNTFGRINVLTLSNRNAVGEEVELLDTLRRMVWTWWSGWLAFGRSRKEAEARTGVSLDIEIRHLSEIFALHTVAFGSFEAARGVLQQWQIDAKNIIADINRYKTYLAGDRYPTWTEWVDLEQLKYEIARLKPLLEKLAGANEKQRLSNLVSQNFWDTRSRECYKEVRENVLGERKARDWEDCFFDGLVVETV